MGISCPKNASLHRRETNPFPSQSAVHDEPKGNQMNEEELLALIAWAKEEECTELDLRGCDN